MPEEKKIPTQDDLLRIQEESQKQALPDQKRIFSVSEKIRRRAHNLPDPTHPPLGLDPNKAYDRLFPFINLPRLHPPNHGDTVIFNAPQLPANQLILGDNLEVLRTLPTESIDLIYIDPPFFSGRNYNVIWGDSNEVRSFFDIWEGGIDTYLLWLNARLWEMCRVLKKTGSIYVHCDWHASHYIKEQMDYIFGYGRDHQNQIKPGFRNEIIWGYETSGYPKDEWAKKHDTILLYSKGKDWKFNQDDVREGYDQTSFARNYPHQDEFGHYRLKNGRKYYAKEGKAPIDFWFIKHVYSEDKERIGYPTQKPEELLERIIKASSNEGDIVADFFCGGGTTLAVALKLKRRFIGCDSSRVAISVTTDRLVKIGEEMSGVMSNISKAGMIQGRLDAEPVPNIEVSYMGVYPIDKFVHLDQESFVDFVLTCYGASHNTAEGVTSGFRPPGQQEPLLIGPANPNDSIKASAVKTFFDEIKAQLEQDKLVRAKIIGWRFDRQLIEYLKILRKYISDNQLPMEIDLVPLDSIEFRKRILQRYQDVEEAEFYLRFSKPPVIGDIRLKKVGALEYEFEAVDAFSSNEDGYLVNCQWDFDYEVGHFAAHKDYILSRQKIKPKGRDERFEAILTATHKFDKPGECTIACKVQDNLAGETVLAKKIRVD